MKIYRIQKLIDLENSDFPVEEFFFLSRANAEDKLNEFKTPDCKPEINGFFNACGETYILEEIEVAE